MTYKVKELREAKGMTQMELAEKSGISRGTICALEGGQKMSVNTNTLIRIADALGVSMDTLYRAPSAQ